MFQKNQNANCKILIASDSEKQKRRLMAGLVASGYRTQSMPASELLKNHGNLGVTTPDLVILDLDSQKFDEEYPLSTQYAKRHGCHILYSLDPRDIKSFNSNHAGAELTYVTNNCTQHELELGIELLRLKTTLEKDSRERRREQWALQALNCISQRSETQENTLDGIVGIVATTLDASCCVMKKDAFSDYYHDLASAGASREDMRKINLRVDTKKSANGNAPTTDLGSTRTGPGPWNPPAKLVARIASRTPAPAFLCVWSDQPRQFSDIERTVVSVAALYSGMAISSPTYEEIS